jgi:hypothetical protein
MTYIVYTKQQFKAAVNDATDKATIKCCGPMDLLHGESIRVPGNMQLIIDNDPIDYSKTSLPFAYPEHKVFLSYGE